MSDKAFTLFPNIPFFCLIAAVFLAFWEHRKKEQPLGQIMTQWFLLLPVGIGGLWWFSFEFFIPVEAARYLGWEPSPFERQLAFGDLATGLVGIVAYFRREYSFSLAAGIGAIVYLGGITYFHIANFVLSDNPSLGNISWTFSCDLITVVVLIVSLYSWSSHRSS